MNPMMKARSGRFFSCKPWGLAALLAGAAALGCSSPAAKQASAPAPEVEVTPAVSRDVQDTDEFTGRVEALFTVDLRPRDGILDQRAVQTGRRR